MMSHISSALIAIRRSPYQALAAILMLWITFFVGYTFSLFFYSSDQILHYFETRPQITAFFKLDAPSANIQTLQDSMTSKPYVDKVTIISKEQALQIYREDNKKDPLLLELVTADILPASIEVSAKDPTFLPQIKQDLENADGVEEVIYQKDVIDTLQKWTTSLRYVGVVSIVILGFTSFFIIIIITGMKVAMKKRAIQIMRILGASRWYVKAPFVYEGMLYGFFGSLAGWTVMYVALLYLTPWITSFLGAIPLLPLPPEFFAIQFAAGTLIGLTLGGISSSVAVQRMMRKA